MDYNETYASSKNVWGNEPSKLLQMIAGDIPEGSDILDLGSAQGRDALYLASLGHRVVAVDKSQVACEQLQERIRGGAIANIESVCADIVKFPIERSRYALISIQNMLQFLEKAKSLEVLNHAKDAVLPGGFLIISAFTVDDPSFQYGSGGLKSHFEKQELLRLCSDFEIRFYFEGKVLDPGHPGFEAPHHHGIVQLVARKV